MVSKGRERERKTEVVCWNGLQSATIWKPSQRAFPNFVHSLFICSNIGNSVDKCRVGLLLRIYLGSFVDSYRHKGCQLPFVFGLPRLTNIINMCPPPPFSSQLNGPTTVSTNTNSADFHCLSVIMMMVMMMMITIINNIIIISGLNWMEWNRFNMARLIETISIQPGWFKSGNIFITMK